MDNRRAFEVPHILVDDIDDSPNAGLDMRRMATAIEVDVDWTMFVNFMSSSPYLSIAIVDVFLYRFICVPSLYWWHSYSHHRCNWYIHLNRNGAATYVYWFRSIASIWILSTPCGLRRFTVPLCSWEDLFLARKTIVKQTIQKSVPKSKYGIW